MPICECACQQCGEKLDVLVCGDEKPACPHDKSRRLTKLLSVVAGHVANPTSIRRESNHGRAKPLPV